MEDEEDVGELLLAGGLAMFKEDKIINPITTGSEDKKSVPPNLTGIANPIVSNGFSYDLATSKKSCQPSNPPTVPAFAGTSTATAAPLAGPKIPHGVLPGNTTTIAGVCFLETPDNFYVCPSSSMDQFMSILAASQSTTPGSVSPVEGTCCLAMDEDCWYSTISREPILNFP